MKTAVLLFQELDIRGPIPYRVSFGIRRDFIESHDHGNQQETDEKGEVKLKNQRILFFQTSFPRPFPS